MTFLEIVHIRSVLGVGVIIIRKIIKRTSRSKIRNWIWRTRKLGVTRLIRHRYQVGNWIKRTRKITIIGRLIVVIIKLLLIRIWCRWVDLLLQWLLLLLKTVLPSDWKSFLALLKIPDGWGSVTGRFLYSGGWRFGWTVNPMLLLLCLNFVRRLVLLTIRTALLTSNNQRFARTLMLTNSSASILKPPLK
jgi:hypothetical protein